MEGWGSVSQASDAIFTVGISESPHPEQDFGRSCLSLATPSTVAELGHSPGPGPCSAPSLTCHLFTKPWVPKIPSCVIFWKFYRLH